MSTGLINHDWYNRNEVRSWPLDETASLVDDNNQFLPFDIIVDLHLLFPRTLGYRAFLGGVTVTDGLATIVFLASGSAFQPLASISVRQPVDLYRQYALSPMVSGVGGWVTFGKGVEEQRGSWRFSSAEKSLLMAKRARSYGPVPVSSVGKLGLEPGLTDLVRFTGGTDVEIVKEERDIGGVLREVAVFRLVNKLDETRQVLDLYTGVCGARPESGNCDGPPPVEIINDVRPDCCGNIYVEFRGCGDLLALSNQCGVMIDCGFGLADACVSPDRMPDANGRLPNEYDSLCEDYTDTGGGTSTTTPASTTSPPGYSPSSDADTLDLPDGTDFNGSLASIGWEVQSSSFSLLQLGGKFGLGQGGNVAKIVANDLDATKAQIVGDAPQGLAVANRVIVFGSSQSGYNRVHTVQSVKRGSFRSDYPFGSNGVGGSWLRLGSDAGPGIGGGNVGSIVSATEDLTTGGVLFTFGETHNLVAGDVIAVAGNSVSGYNTTHVLQAVRSSTAVVSIISHTSDGSGGAWTHNLPASGGRITSVAATVGGRALVTFAGATDLDAGDFIVIAGASSAAANQAGFIQRMATDTTAIVDIPYSGVFSTGGIWKVVGSTLTTPKDNVLQSSASGRAMAIWSSGLPASVSWSSWHKRAKLLFAMQQGPAGSRVNGGLLFNYRDTSNYCLAEVNWDTSRLLRLWRVQTGQFQLIAQVETPPLTLNSVYSLTADILPFNLGNSSSAHVSVRLAGAEDEVSVLLGPVELQNFTPATGRFGVHANLAVTNFEDLAVTFLNP